MKGKDKFSASVRKRFEGVLNRVRVMPSSEERLETLEARVDKLSSRLASVEDELALLKGVTRSVLAR
jgi:chaperonin cofactor prefoldin